MVLLFAIHSTNLELSSLSNRTDRVDPHMSINSFPQN